MYTPITLKLREANIKAITWVFTVNNTDAFNKCLQAAGMYAAISN